MKKFLPQLKGHNIRNDDMMLVQQACFEAIEGIINTFDPTGNGNCILSGLTYTTSTLGSSTTYTFNAGYVALQGEVYVFPAQSIVLPTFSPPPLFLHVIETPISPSSPVPYADGTNKNVHFDRTAKVDGITAGGEIYFPMTGWNSIYLTDLAHANVVQKGLVMEFYPDPTYPGGHEENAVFDNTGLGIGRMKGYAACNGLNGTPDLRGQFTFTPSAGTMFGASSAAGALIANVIAGININTRTGSINNTILTNNLPTAPVTITMNPHHHSFTSNGHNHGIVAQSKISKDVSMDTEIDDTNHWSYYAPSNSNWVSMWHNQNLGLPRFAWATGSGYTHGVNWINPLMEPGSPPDGNNDGATGYFEATGPAAMPHVSWVIDVNTPFDDWSTNGLHSQQPSGYQIGNVGNAKVGYDSTHPAGSGMTGGFPGDVGYSWSPSTNTSYPDPGVSTTLMGATIGGDPATGSGTYNGELTTNGYQMLFNNKITDSTVSGTTDNATSTGTGIINNGGTQHSLIVIPPSFAMIKILRIL